MTAETIEKFSRVLAPKMGSLSCECARDVLVQHAEQDPDWTMAGSDRHAASGVVSTN